MQQGSTLGKIIEANTNITNLQPDVFKFTASIGGRVVSSASAHRAHPTPSQGLSGVTVELVDGSGDVLATTVTDKSGAYRFNQLDGVSGTGDYTVRIVVPPGFAQTSRAPSTIAISRGGVSIQKVDFTLART